MLCNDLYLPSVKCFSCVISEWTYEFLLTAQSTAEAEQIKKEKLEMEESYSEKLAESEKSMLLF